MSQVVYIVTSGSYSESQYLRALQNFQILAKLEAWTR